MTAKLCTIDGCPGKHMARGWCQAHYMRWWTKGDVGNEPIGLPAHLETLTGAQHPNWAGAGIGYNGAHQRVRNKRGAASLHCCVDCDGQAAHWSYRGGDPNELRDERGLAYSANPGYYEPRCVRCHSAHDRGVAV